MITITIRTRWIITFCGWYTTPSYVTASLKLWLLWLWRGHDYTRLYWGPFSWERRAGGQ